MINVSSEIGELKKVIVHRPDAGIARVSPKKAEELLFDDIVYLPKMQEEHDVFTKVLEAFVGKGNVLEVETLLKEALEQGSDGKKLIIEKVIDFEELPPSYEALLSKLSNDELVKVLITGYLESEDHFLFPPIPNFIFTRDIAIVVNDHIIITKAAKSARHRENFLTRFICLTHPIFKTLRKQNRIINLNTIEDFPPSKKGEVVSMEGGDMMIINENYILLGCSERSTEHGIHSLRDKLFELGIIDNVAQVNIPHDRSFMHIDTIFTQINKHHVMAYKPIVIDGLGSYVEVFRKDGTKIQYPSIKEFWEQEIDDKVEFICSGQGESPYQEREQWTDGCNLVAIRPGIALTYDRNTFTELALKKAGYSIMSANEFLETIAIDKQKLATLTNTIITLPSSELSRARGGSHCMTCPIQRN